jgi:hypothetical protein
MSLVSTGRSGKWRNRLFLLTDDDVLDLQVRNTVLEGRKKVGIGVDNHVGNVTMNENSSSVLSHNHVGVDTGIGASYGMILKGSRNVLEKLHERDEG